MKSQFLILTALLSSVATNRASATNNLTEDEKIAIILAADPEDKDQLQRYLFESNEHSVDLNVDLNAIREILEKMRGNDWSTKPMMTMKIEGK